MRTQEEGDIYEPNRNGMVTTSGTQTLIPDFSLQNTEEQLLVAKVIYPVKFCHSVPS